MLKAAMSLKLDVGDVSELFSKGDVREGDIMLL